MSFVGLEENEKKEYIYINLIFTWGYLIILYKKIYAI